MWNANVIIAVKKYLSKKVNIKEPNIIFATEKLDGVYDPVFYFKSDEDVSNIVKWVHTQFPDEE